MHNYEHGLVCDHLCGARCWKASVLRTAEHEGLLPGKRFDENSTEPHMQTDLTASVWAAGFFIERRPMTGEFGVDDVTSETEAGSGKRVLTATGRRDRISSLIAGAPRASKRLMRLSRCDDACTNETSACKSHSHTFEWCALGDCSAVVSLAGTASYDAGAAGSEALNLGGEPCAVAPSMDPERERGAKSVMNLEKSDMMPLGWVTVAWGEDGGVAFCRT